MILFPDYHWGVAATIVPTWGTVMGSFDDALKESLQTLNDEFDTADYSTTGVLSVRDCDDDITVTRST